MLSIGTNMSSSYAKAAASSAAKSMDVAMERLSTGQRLNAARDDAAGVAIASRLESSVRGLTQSIRNAIDAEAMLDTAEGGLATIETTLQRLRELALQAANDTNSQADRVSLNSEAEQLLMRIETVSSSTNWAGKSLLIGETQHFYLTAEVQVELPELNLQAQGLIDRTDKIEVKKTVSKITTTRTTVQVDTPAASSAESIVNTASTFTVATPTVASLANGNTLLVWVSKDVSAGPDSLKFKILDPTGNAVLEVSSILQPVNKKDMQPSLVALQDGGFALSWVRSNLDGTGSETYLQILESDGSPRTSQLKAGIFGIANPNIAQLTNGSIVIANEGTIDRTPGDFNQGIGVTIYSPQGSLIRSEFKGHSITNNGQHSPHVIPLTNGGFVVSFHSSAISSSWEVRAQAFSSFGNRVGSEFLVGSAPSAFNPTGHKLSGGGFFISWQQSGLVYSKMFNDSGQAVSASIKINEGSGASDVQVIEAGNGDFIFSWSAPDGSGTGIYGRRYSSSLTPIGNEFRINDNTSGRQNGARLFTIGSDGFGAVWASDGQQSSGDSVIKRSFSFETTVENQISSQETVMVSEDIVVEGVSLLSRITAQAAISIIDSTLQFVSGSRAKLGAYNNRLDHALNNLTNMKVNLSFSKGAISDAAFAAEITKFTANQIIFDGSLAMLAQANADPGSVRSIVQDLAHN